MAVRVTFLVTLPHSNKLNLLMHVELVLFLRGGAIIGCSGDFWQAEGSVNSHKNKYTRHVSVGGISRLFS